MFINYRYAATLAPKLYAESKTLDPAVGMNSHTKNSAAPFV